MLNKASVQKSQAQSTSLKEEFIKKCDEMGLSIPKPFQRENKDYVVFTVEAPVRKESEQETIEIDFENLKSLKLMFFNNIIDVAGIKIPVNSLRLERQHEFESNNGASFTVPSRLIAIIHLNLNYLEWDII